MVHVTLTLLQKLGTYALVVNKFYSTAQLVMKSITQLVIITTLVVAVGSAPVEQNNVEVGDDVGVRCNLRVL